MGRASNSMCKPLVGLTVPFFTTVDFQTTHKMIDSGYPLNTVNDMMYYKERHLLLLEYSVSFIEWIRMIRRASGSIYNPLMVHTISFL